MRQMKSNSVITAEVESGTGYTVGSSSSASVTVNDNDDSTGDHHSRVLHLSRKGRLRRLLISASSAPTAALTVNVDVSEDGDVISGTPSSTVTIDANATTATLTVATDNEGADEAVSVVTAEVDDWHRLLRWAVQRMRA